MELTGIISMAGKPGLYKVVARSKGGLIVESLLDGKKVSAHATSRISALEDISMYTYGEEVPLKDVFTNLFKLTEGKEAINPKQSSDDELKAFFEQVLPEYDRDRVYPSDVKKLFTWFNLLLSKGLLKLAEEKEDKPKAKKKPAAKKVAEETPVEVKEEK